MKQVVSTITLSLLGVMFADVAHALNPPSPIKQQYETTYIFSCPATSSGTGLPTSTVQQVVRPGQFQVTNAPCANGTLMSWTTILLPQ